MQTKVFLSRIPVREGGYPTLGPAGQQIYHSLDKMLGAIYNKIEDIDSFKLFDELAKSDDPVLIDMFAALKEMKAESINSRKKWKFSPEQVERQLISAVHLQFRNVRTLRIKEKVNQAGNTIVSSDLLMSNRQSVQFQLIDNWESNYRQMVSTYYSIEKRSVDGIMMDKITGLKRRSLKTYEKAGKQKIDISFPTAEELKELRGGQIVHAYSDLKYAMYQQLKDAINEANEKPNETFDIVIPEDDEYVLREKDKELTTITRREILELFGFMNFPKKSRQENLKLYIQQKL